MLDEEISEENEELKKENEELKEDLDIFKGQLDLKILLCEQFLQKLSLFVFKYSKDDSNFLKEMKAIIMKS